MQQSLSLNNFGVRPSDSNPGDGASEVFCRCLINGNKTKIAKKKKQSRTKCPKFRCNTVSVSFSACRCSLVAVSSKEEKKKSVWRQLCECLSEAVAHLPITVSQLLLPSLVIADLRVILTLT
jgi:hypothetical protein